MKVLAMLTAVLSLLGLGVPARGAEHFVGPNGKANAAGTMEDPWDMLSALDGSQRKIQPGDTVWVLGGKYRCAAAYEKKTLGFEVNLAGEEGKPILVRARPGERATIDGGVFVSTRANHLWLQDLEITVTPDTPVEPVTQQSGSWPNDLGAPNGGLTIQGGTGCKFINLYIHENYGGGVGWWLGSKDGEMYGCVIVNNGWKGPDRNHGHCIYTQNDDGVKTIRNNILKTRWGNGQYSMHAYGSARAYVNNFLIEQNIAYGPASFLVGGGRPSHGIRVLNNYVHGHGMQIGYSAPENEDAEIVGNLVVRGGISINRYKKVLAKDNTVIGGGIGFNNCQGVEQENNRLLNQPPADPVIVLQPNAYDPNRANLAIFNFAKAEQVAVNVADFLKPGEVYRLMDPEDLYGEPVAKGTCEGPTISVPLKEEFGVFVVFKEAQ